MLPLRLEPGVKGRAVHVGQLVQQDALAYCHGLLPHQATMRTIGQRMMLMRFLTAEQRLEVMQITPQKRRVAPEFHMVTGGAQQPKRFQQLAQIVQGLAQAGQRRGRGIARPEQGRQLGAQKRLRTFDQQIGQERPAFVEPKRVNGFTVEPDL